MLAAALRCGAALHAEGGLSWAEPVEVNELPPGIAALALRS
jgi:hypothetical protein